MKRLLKIVAILFALVLVAAVALPFLVDANAFRPQLEANLTQALGRKVDLGDLKLSLLSGSVAATRLSIADDPAFSPTPFLRAQSLKVNVELPPLVFSRKLNVTGVVIDQPEVDLWQTPEGKWNFSSIGGDSAKIAPGGPAAGGPPANAGSSASPGAMDLTVKSIRITGGTFSLGVTGGKSKPERLEKVDIELRDFSAQSAFPFSLSAAFAGGGTVKLSGQAGPINSADASTTPFDAKLAISHLDLLASGFVNPDTGLAGLASIDGSVASTGRVFTVQGKVTADGLKLARAGTPAKPSVAVEIALSYDLQSRSGKLEQGAVHIGKAAANLTGTYVKEGDSAAVHLKLSGPSMPVDDLAAMLPALNISLPSGSSLQGGTAAVDVSSDGPLGRLTTAGSLAVNGTSLANYDLGSKLQALEKFTGIQAGKNTAIQTFSAQVHNTVAGTDIQNLNLVVPAIGTLTGAGTINPAQELDFKLMVALHATGGMLTALGQKGDTQVPLTVTGTASNPVFRPDLKAVVGDKLKKFTADPSKAADTAKGILNLFKRSQ